MSSSFHPARPATVAPPLYSSTHSLLPADGLARNSLITTPAGYGVAVGVPVGGTDVFVGGAAVLVGAIGVSVGGTGVFVGVSVGAGVYVGDGVKVGSGVGPGDVFQAPCVGVPFAQVALPSGVRAKLWPALALL